MINKYLLIELGVIGAAGYFCVNVAGLLAYWITHR